MLSQRITYLSIVWFLASTVYAAGASRGEAIEFRSDSAFSFTEADGKFLDEVQHGCFLYLWKQVGQPACLVNDRLTAPISSTAAVGFQLSSLPIGVERGWITRAEGEARAATVLRALIEHANNKKDGIYLHFVDENTGGLKLDAPQVQASTIDHALLQAGAIPAATYFGGEVSELTERLIADANWNKYVDQQRQLISFGWRPDNPAEMDGPGDLRPWVWHVMSAEELLVYFLAVGSPNPEHAVPPEMYFRPTRKVSHYGDSPPYVVSWNGTMFTYFFHNCWIDYARFEADDPAAFGAEGPRVNWFENSRRAFLTHRNRCLAEAETYRTLGPNRWGLGPCMGLRPPGVSSYLVQDLLPNHSGIENWRRGTVAPYVAGSAMPFMPRESLAALREMRNLKRPDGAPFVWRDPSEGGYGFLDSFNLDQMHVPDDYIGIDVGPMLLMIENARTGLVWRLFHEHPSVQRSVEKLKLRPLESPIRLTKAQP